MTTQDTPLTPLQKIAISRKLFEADIISRAWEDAAFRAKLEADTAAALSEAGFLIPEGRTLRILTEAPDAVTIILPARPEGGAEVADEELAGVAGGSLLNGGRCRVYEDVKSSHAQGDPFAVTQSAIAAAAVSAFGGSWGWGE